MLLTGSGYSIPAGDPSVERLTQTVFGRNWSAVGQPSEASVLEAVFKAVRRFTSDFVSRWLGGREVNYEDVAYVLRQIQDLDEGELENPLAAAYLFDLAKQLARSPPTVARAARSLSGLLIADVSDWLWPPEDEGEAQYPQLLLDALSDRLAGVVSLNHDLLLERNVSGFYDRFADGFAEPSPGGIAWWADHFRIGSTPFVKLHGSVDWRRAIATDGSRPNSVVTSRTRLYPSSHLLRSQQQLALDLPTILCGTFNKTLDYHRGIFMDLHWRFMSLLRDCSLVVAVGYGFADKAVNSALIRWMMASDGRRLFVRDIHPEALMERARHAVSRSFQAWKKDDRVVLDAGCASKLHESPALGSMLA